MRKIFLIILILSAFLTASDTGNIVYPDKNDTSSADYSDKCTILLSTAERFNTLAHFYGGKYFQEDLRSVRIKINSCETLSTGEMKKVYREFEKTCNKILENSLSYLNRVINTSSISDGVPLTVFNSLSWERNGIVRYVFQGRNKNSYSVSDINGNLIPSIITGDTIYFTAGKVPSMGYKTFILRKTKSPLIENSAEDIILKENFADISSARRIYEYKFPLIAVLNTIHQGEIPPVKSLVSLNDGNLILTILKKSEFSPTFIIQWYETEGKDSESELVLPFIPLRVVESNENEEDRKEVMVFGNRINIETERNSVKTLKIYMR